MVEQIKLTEGSIRPQLMKIAVPMSVGLFFNTLFNVVDTFYAGRLGTESLAGMSASFSVFFIQNALLSGLATGVSALMAQALGGKVERQRGLPRPALLTDDRDCRHGDVATCRHDGLSRCFRVKVGVAWPLPHHALYRTNNMIR